MFRIFQVSFLATALLITPSIYAQAFKFKMDHMREEAIFSNHFFTKAAKRLGFTKRFPVKGFYTAEIRYYSDDKIILRADTCDELQYHLEAFHTWKGRFEKVQAVDLDCVKDPITSINIANLIPEAALELLERYPACDGPNCFNSALVAAGILPYQRFTSQKEWETTLSNHCKETDQPSPGDLVSIIRSNGEHLHGFTYINDFFAASKADLNSGSAYQIKNFFDDVEVFESDPENVKNKISYYKCDLSSLPQQPKGLTSFDSLISECAVNDPSQIFTFFDSFKRLKPYLNTDSYEEQAKHLLKYIDPNKRDPFIEILYPKSIQKR